MSFQSISHLQHSLALSHVSIPEMCVGDLQCARHRHNMVNGTDLPLCSCNCHAAELDVAETTTQTISHHEMGPGREINKVMLLGFLTGAIESEAFPKEATFKLGVKERRNR